MEAKFSITIVFNNIPGKEGLKTGMGFSAWITYNDKTILFDTGCDGTTLLYNIRQLGLNIQQLDALMVSHNHWDHVYGIPDIIRNSGKMLNVYTPEPANRSLQIQNPSAQFVPVTEPIELLPGIMSTGCMRTSYNQLPLNEHSLIINHPAHIIVITGCSHPGIVNIVKKAKEATGNDKVLLTAGGFHLHRYSRQEITGFSDSLKSLNVEYIAPSHCTGEEAIQCFKEEWGNQFVDLNLGQSYEHVFPT